MEVANLSGISVQQLIDSINKANSAEVRRSSDLRPRMALRLTIALDVAATSANPFVIPNPFNGVYVEAASDTATNVQLALGGLDKYSTDNYTSLYLNASFKSDYAVKQAVLTWPAQASKTITIIFYLGIDFRPGSQVSTINGAVSVIGGSSIATGKISSSGAAASVVVGSGAAVQLCVSNTNRKAMNFYTDGAIWVGDSNVSIGRGTRVLPGIFSFENTGILYAIADGGSATVSGTEEA